MQESNYIDVMEILLRMDKAEIAEFDEIKQDFLRDKELMSLYEDLDILIVAIQNTALETTLEEKVHKLKKYPT